MSKQTFLTILRNKDTGTAAFRQAAERLAFLLAAEAAAELHTEVEEIETPLAKMQGVKLKNQIILLPILRAGLSMLHPFMQLYPDCKVGFLGVKRDEETALPHFYYKNLPTVNGSQFYIVLDPMIATGGSGAFAIKMLKEIGITDDKILYVGMVAAPEGIAKLKKIAPRMKIICAEIDKKLNAKKYIVPGLGDFGDRYFGTE